MANLHIDFSSVFKGKSLFFSYYSFKAQYLGTCQLPGQAWDFFNYAQCEKGKKKRKFQTFFLSSFLFLFPLFSLDIKGRRGSFLPSFFNEEVEKRRRRSEEKCELCPTIPFPLLSPGGGRGKNSLPPPHPPTLKKEKRGGPLPAPRRENLQHCCILSPGRRKEEVPLAFLKIQGYFFEISFFPVREFDRRGKSSDFFPSPPLSRNSRWLNLSIFLFFSFLPPPDFWLCWKGNGAVFPNFSFLCKRGLGGPFSYSYTLPFLGPWKKIVERISTFSQWQKKGEMEGSGLT